MIMQQVFIKTQPVNDNVLKWSNTLSKSCWKCCKIFTMCLTFRNIIYERDNLELKLTKFRKERKTKQRTIEKSKKRFEWVFYSPYFSAKADIKSFLFISRFFVTELVTCHTIFVFSKKSTSQIWSFLLKNSSFNVTKFTNKYTFGHTY